MKFHDWRLWSFVARNKHIAEFYFGREIAEEEDWLYISNFIHSTASHNWLFLICLIDIMSDKIHRTNFIYQIGSITDCRNFLVYNLLLFERSNWKIRNLLWSIWCPRKQIRQGGVVARLKKANNSLVLLSVNLFGFLPQEAGKVGLSQKDDTVSLTALLTPTFSVCLIKKSRNAERKYKCNWSFWFTPEITGV